MNTFSPWRSLVGLVAVCSRRGGPLHHPSRQHLAPRALFTCRDVECVETCLVQRAGNRPDAQWQHTFNLESLVHLTRSSLNACLTSCDRWCRTPAFLPSSPNRVAGTFSAVEPVLYAFDTGTKLRPGTGSLRSRASLAGLSQRVAGRRKRHGCPGLLRSYVLKGTVRPSFDSGGIAGGFDRLCT